ncbi:MAG: hypothetical protein SFV15_16310 [Polyangiaceae bacterium]|nr:hypothetical protein [Polyangiaceae bacterium]
MTRLPFLFALTASAALTIGCGAKLAAPFNHVKESNVTAFRLQNYEPPPAAAAPSSATAAPGQVPGLPPQLQQWISQAAQTLPQLIPPGLLPPGMLPQANQAPLPPAVDTTPRFHTFRILNQTQVIDSSLKDELAEILGNPDNFQAEHASCAYAEVGLSFSSNSGASSDLLISFSCNHVMPQTFTWPHPNTGLKPETVQKLSKVVNKLWPPGM